MQGEIYTTRRDSESTLRPATDLGDRLDAAIGETSSGIGALLSELLRRSLKAGVTDVGDLLADHAQQRVESAVQGQMPQIAEAADAVAESTSRRVVRAAVEEWSERSAEQQQRMESRIQSVEENAVDQATLRELRVKAKQSWNRLKEELDRLHSAHQQLQGENDSLKSLLTQARSQADQQQQQLSDLLAKSGELADRLAELEKPKGIRALLGKFRRSPKQA